MNIRKNLKIIIPVCILILVVAISVCMFAGKKSTDSVSIPVSSNNSNLLTNEAAKNFNFTEEELREIIMEIAKERFGTEAYVLPLSTDGPSLVEIEGKERYVYIYAADSLSDHAAADNIKGLYHVDPVTGEIFDNGNGKMEKIMMESDLNEEE